MSRCWLASRLVLWQRSPVRLIANCDTPILLVQGENDARVPLSQSEILHQYLSLRNREKPVIVPTKLRLYPGEGHGNRKAAARDDYSRRLIRWMDHFVMERKTELPAWELGLGTESDDDDEDEDDDAS